MSFATYGALKTSIAAWINRTDLTAIIPDFVTLAESNIRRDVRTRDQLTDLTVTVTSNLAPLPADFLEARHIKADVDGYPRTLEYVTESIYDTQPLAGQARFFTVSGPNIKVQGLADGDVLLSYYAKYDAFSADADTNWLLLNAPEIYLFSSLVEALTYVRDDEGALGYYTRYSKVVKDLNDHEKKALFSGPARVRAA